MHPGCFIHVDDHSLMSHPTLTLLLRRLLCFDQASQLILHGDGPRGGAAVEHIAAAWLEGLGADRVHLRLSNNHKTAPAGQVSALNCTGSIGCLQGLLPPLP